MLFSRVLNTKSSGLDLNGVILFYYLKFLIIFIYGDIGRPGRGPSMRVGSFPLLCGFLGIKFRLSSLAASTFICWVTLPDLILIKYGLLQTKQKQKGSTLWQLNRRKSYHRSSWRKQEPSSLWAEDSSTVCQGTDSILWRALHHHHHSLEATCGEALDLGF